MNQMGFSELESAAKKKRTHRERFLGQIEAATPWALLVEQIEPFYPNGERGRLPIGLGWATARDECRLSARQQSLVRSRWLPAWGRSAPLARNADRRWWISTRSVQPSPARHPPRCQGI
jgi:hypothetical protein